MRSVSVTEAVGEMREKKDPRIMTGRLELGNRRSSQEKTGLHAGPGFVTTDGASPHLHTSNGLLGGIVGPRDLGFRLKGAVILPMVTQTQKQVAQLLDGGTSLARQRTTTGQLLPE